MNTRSLSAVLLPLYLAVSLACLKMTSPQKHMVFLFEGNQKNSRNIGAECKIALRILNIFDDTDSTFKLSPHGSQLPTAGGDWSNWGWEEGDGDGCWGSDGKNKNT